MSISWYKDHEHLVHRDPTDDHENDDPRDPREFGVLPSEPDSSRWSTAGSTGSSTTRSRKNRTNTTQQVRAAVASQVSRRAPQSSFQTPVAQGMACRGAAGKPGPATAVRKAASQDVATVISQWMVQHPTVRSNKECADALTALGYDNICRATVRRVLNDARTRPQPEKRRAIATPKQTPHVSEVRAAEGSSAMALHSSVRRYKPYVPPECQIPLSRPVRLSVCNACGIVPEPLTGSCGC